MTWGQGYGLPWGSGSLVGVAEPTSQVGGPPITFDLTDEPDGPLPGCWETYVLDTGVAGDVTVSAEGSPDVYYRVLSGLGLWAYTRAPVISGVGVPFQERGVAAGPAGVLVGRNARMAVVLASPMTLLGDKDEELFYEVSLGLRFTTAPYGFVGGRARAKWEAGVWTTPMALEAVMAIGQAPTVLA